MVGSQSAFHRRAPWETGKSEGDFDKDTWELYNLNDDFSQATDLAASNPAKVKQMQSVFDREAKKYNVYPLDDRTAERFDVALRPSPITGQTSFVYRQGVRAIPEGSAPNTKQGPHTITIDLVSAGQTGGVLVAFGGEAAGWSIYLQNGKPTYFYNFFGAATYKLNSSQALAKGKSTIRVEAHANGTWSGQTAKRRYVCERQESRLGHSGQVGTICMGSEFLDVGMDLVSPVSNEYTSPNAFNGQIDKVQIDLGK